METVLFVAALALLAALLIGSGRRLLGATRWAFVLGCGAGICFGLVAVLLKMTTATIGEHGLVEALVSWPAWGLVLAGLSGVMTNQFAYRTARLSASMPVLNIVDCLVAVGFGYLVFNETPRHSPTALVVEAVGLVTSFIGLWLLFQYEEGSDAGRLEELFRS
jgi:drug/metabolite transporter (DMT)-like permease